jgi:hypothetical protein
LRRVLLPSAFFLTLFALTLVVTGGFVTSVGGVRVSARSPGAAWIGAAALVVWWFVLARRASSVRDDLTQADAWVTRHASFIVVVIGALAGAVALRFNSFSAGGSDASGYLSYVVMLASGEITRVEPLAAIADWRDAQTTLVPLGWRVGLDAGVQVPTYAVGLPLLMLFPHVVGGIVAASSVVPMSLFVAVVAIGRLAHRLGGAVAGIVAATWLASSPVALIEAMQPMSDVPVTAAWLVCLLLVMTDRPEVTAVPAAGSSIAARSESVARSSFVARSSVVAGLVAALAILIRPNLAPLAAIPALYYLRRREMRGAMLFALPVVVAGFVVAYLQWRYFGSPLHSGYGSASEIYAISNLAPNAALYTRWLFETHGPWLLLAPVAAFWPSASRSVMRWLLLFGSLVLVSYLLSSVFEMWTYLRYILPTLALAVVAVSVVVSALVAKAAASVRAPLTAILVLSVAMLNITTAKGLGVFRFADQQRRASLAGRYLESALPLNAVVIAGEQSGATRYYTRRSIVRWDFLDPAAYDESLNRLEASGYDAWIALDTWEEDLFRTKFRGTASAALDWPPVVEAGTEIRMRAWRIRDRARHISGERVSSDRLR